MASKKAKNLKKAKKIQAKKALSFSWGVGRG